MLISALGGLDGLVFAAGIGEHAPPIREAVCARLAWSAYGSTTPPMPRAWIASVPLTAPCHSNERGRNERPPRAGGDLAISHLNRNRSHDHFDKPLVAEADAAPERQLDVEDLGAMAAFLMSDDAHHVTGTIIPEDSGQHLMA